MRIAVLEIPQQGDERNDFSVLSGFDWKLIRSDCAASFGFSRRCLIFLTLCSGFLPVYRRSCLSHGRSLCLGCSRDPGDAIANPGCSSLRDGPRMRGVVSGAFSPFIPDSRFAEGLRMGKRVGKSPPILAEARQVIVLDACACRSHDSRVLHFRGPSLRQVACQCCRTALDHYRWWPFGYLLIPGRPIQAVDIVLAVFGGNLTSWAGRARHVKAWCCTTRSSTRR